MDDIKIAETFLGEEKIIALSKDNVIIQYWIKANLPEVMNEDFDVITTYRSMITRAFVKGMDIGRKEKRDEILEVLGLRK